MIKTFTNYLDDAKKSFSFKLWFANADFDDAQLEKLERCLEKFKLEDIAKPKTLPTTKHDWFPGRGPVELTTIDVTLSYPCNATQVHDAIVRSGMNIPARDIVTMTKGQAEGQDVTYPDFSQYPAKDALLDTDYAASNDNGENYGEKHISSFLKSLQTGTSTAKTTNDIPQGTKSPVGSNKSDRRPIKTGSKK